VKKQDQKREEAEKRNAAWAALPLAEQAQLLDVRPGNSTRQRRRLEKQQAKNDA